MSSRDLPARPDLDHLKHEAKALHRAFHLGDPAAVKRIGAVLGARVELKLTAAQRVVAREYGFPSWAKLRAHVLARRSHDDAVSAFLSAIVDSNLAAADAVLRAHPQIARGSLHVAAVLGLDSEVRRLITLDPPQVRVRAGSPHGEPLLWLCYSPFHGESGERDEGLAAAARALLDAGADPNTRDGRYGVPALFAVTGLHNAPRVARMLLEAGAEPTDGESVFHAAERFHLEALELLRAHGVNLNATGEWGNTPLYYLLRYWDVEAVPRVKQGLLWLLEHGADPNVPCGRERETPLHVAARRGQHPGIIQLLLDRRADVHARRGDGRTALLLARRGAHEEVAALLERAGAEPVALLQADALVAACCRGDTDAARAVGSADLVASLGLEEVRLLPEAASAGRVGVVLACLDAGIPVDTPDEAGATALHHGAIRGRVGMVGELLRRGADVHQRDGEHGSSPLGWACFGADHVADPAGDYAGTVRVLLEAGARRSDEEHEPRHQGVRELLEVYGRGRE